jgi:hypothetical protein
LKTEFQFGAAIRGVFGFGNVCVSDIVSALSGSDYPSLSDRRAPAAAGDIV